jgi:hypothetical protein
VGLAYGLGMLALDAGAALLLFNAAVLGFGALGGVVALLAYQQQLSAASAGALPSLTATAALFSSSSSAAAGSAGWYTALATAAAVHSAGSPAAEAVTTSLLCTQLTAQAATLTAALGSPSGTPLSLLPTTLSAALFALDRGQLAASSTSTSTSTSTSLLSLLPASGSAAGSPPLPALLAAQASLASPSAASALLVPARLLLFLVPWAPPASLPMPSTLLSTAGSSSSASASQLTLLLVVSDAWGGWGWPGGL